MDEEEFRGNYMVSYSVWSGGTSVPMQCAASWYDTLEDLRDSLRIHRCQGRYAVAYKYDEGTHRYVQIDE